MNKFTAVTAAQNRFNRAEQASNPQEALRLEREGAEFQAVALRLPSNPSDDSFLLGGEIIERNPRREPDGDLLWA